MRGPLLVVCGPGVGHYVPISDFLRQLPIAPAQVHVVARVIDESAVAAMCHRDGFHFRAWRGGRPTFPSRAFDAAGRAVLPALAERLATVLPGDEMPSLAARAVFALRSYTRPVADAVPGRVAALAELVREVAPTLCLVDQEHRAAFPHVAAASRVRWLEYTICPVEVVRAGRPLYPLGLPPRPSFAGAFVDRAARGAVRARAVVQRRRLRACGPQTTPPLGTVAFSTRALDDYVGVPGHGWTYVGIPGSPCLGGPPATTERGDVLVSFGSTHAAAHDHLYDMVANAVRADLPGRQVVLQVQDPVARARLDAAWAHDELVAVVPPTAGPPVEHLRRAAVVVTHGGYRTVVESMASGAPVLVLPELRGDRMEVAQRVAANGVGLVLNPLRVTPTRLGAALVHLATDTEVRGRVELVRRELEASTAAWRSALPVDLFG